MFLELEVAGYSAATIMHNVYNSPLFQARNSKSNNANKNSRKPTLAIPVWDRILDNYFEKTGLFYAFHNYWNPRMSLEEPLEDARNVIVSLDDVLNHSNYSLGGSRLEQTAAIARKWERDIHR